jgi:hypothetical protein
MANAGLTWKLAGRALGMAFAETGRGCLEGIHSGLAAMAEATKPKEVQVVEVVEQKEKEEEKVTCC